MESSILFNKMKEAHKTYNRSKGVLADENAQFIRYATLLARKEEETGEENPFTKESLAYDDYFDFMYFYHKWPQSKPACAFKTAFLDKAELLCNYENPFVKEKDSEQVKVVSFEELKNIEYKAKEIEDILSETHVSVKENPPKQIFGITPSKKYHKSRRDRK